MDYKELIKELRFLSKFVPEQICDDNGKDALEKAADAIETLLKERDAAIKDIPRECSYCKYWENDTIEQPCYDCWHSCGPEKNWKWRGLNVVESYRMK